MQERLGSFFHKLPQSQSSRFFVITWKMALVPPGFWPHLRDSRSVFACLYVSERLSFSVYVCVCWEKRERKTDEDEAVSGWSMCMWEWSASIMLTDWHWCRKVLNTFNPEQQLNLLSAFLWYKIHSSQLNILSNPTSVRSQLTDLSTSRTRPVVLLQSASNCKTLNATGIQQYLWFILKVFSWFVLNLWFLPKSR